MRSNKITTITTMALLAVTGTVPFFMPDGIIAEAAGASNTFEFKGVMRDFRRTDTNFAVVPTGGNGHYAGNVMLDLPSDGRPVYQGGGFKVASQWKDEGAHPIAPHMYVDPGSGQKDVRVVTAPEIKNKPTIDTFDPLAGPYGPTNRGPAPAFITGSTMPTLAEPTGLGPMLTEVKHDGNGTTTISNSFRTQKFLIGNNRTVKIEGNLTVLVAEEFKIENHARIDIMPNSSLTMYVKKDCTFQNNTNVNMNTCKPALFMLYNLGTKEIMIENGADMYGRIVSPNAFINVKNNCDFHGSITAKTMKIENSAGVHIENSVPSDSCGAELHDVLGTKGIDSNGGLVSATAFSRWYMDVMNTNLSMPFTMTLWKNSAGVWEHINNAFFPLDRKLFGNQGQLHNYYFTFGATCEFTHHACANTFFEFSGADDAWLFIDNEMVMDRGGVIPATKQYVAMDRLGLVDGQKYRLHFFYAQRNASVSQFNLRTNLDLIPATDPMQFTMGAD